MNRDFAGLGGEWRAMDGGVETVARYDSEAGSVTEEGKTIDDQYRCPPHPGLQG